MSFFVQAGEPRLYLRADAVNDAAWLAYVTPAAAGPAIELGPAYNDPAIGGTFVFSTSPPALADVSAQTAFVEAISRILQKIAPSRAVLWLLQPGAISIDTVAVLGLAPDGSEVASRLTANLTDTWSFFITSSVALALPEGATTLALSATGVNQIGFDGPSKPVASNIGSATLDFAGPRTGILAFSVFVQRESLVSTLAMGFQFLIPSADPVITASSEWAPLASAQDPSPTDSIGFLATIDPGDPTNEVLPDRTVLTFTGKNQDETPTLLVSYYRTAFGHGVSLAPIGAAQAGAGESPAGLEIALGEPADSNTHTFRMSPRGDFVLVVDNPTEDSVLPLLCGWSGTETLSAAPRSSGYAGDRLRFSPRQAAFAPAYPPPLASPVLPPFDPDAPLLTTEYTTSWASVLRAPGAGGEIAYSAEPKGAPLLGRDGLVFAARKTLFGPNAPSLGVPADRVFPLVPYAGLVPSSDPIESFPPATVEAFERDVIGPTRRAAIGQAGSGARTARALLLPHTRAEDPGPATTTTPSGLLVTLADGFAWKKILLAQNTSPALRQLCFCNPDGALQQAFQTSQSMLVIASPRHTGAPSGPGTGACGAQATFQNQMNIGDWEIAVNVGQNQYADYSNVILVKGRRGALFDPRSDAAKKASLVSNPSMWTQAKDLAVPGEEIALSAWLQAYFQRAADSANTPSPGGAGAPAAPSPYFEKFNAIARDPDWTGILVLRATIAGVPTDLAGIVSGVTDPSSFNVHHLGLETSHVANDPAAPDIVLTHDTSMFGLIAYSDPSYAPPPAGQSPEPVPPQPGVEYDFRLLTLNVLFENTAVKRFESLAQLTLNSLFDMQVQRMGEGGNNLNTILLQGSYQKSGDAGTYALRTDTASTFYFGSNLFRKIEIDSVAMSTLRIDPAPDGDVVSQFGLTGFLDFAVIADRDGQPFDVLSYGNEEDLDLLRKGLSFSNLAVVMAAPKNDGASRTLAFDPSGIRFDPRTSTARPGSLAAQLVLGVRSLVRGDADTPPSKQGYLTVLSDAMLSGVDGGAWYGLSFDLSMGSPGALAGGVGLKSTVLLGWSPSSAGEDRYSAMIGIALPGTGGGAKLISLQNVLRLSIGQIRLTRDKGKQAFLLMLTEIALKFLGLLKIPPNGSTVFYLFGDPAGGGDPSGLGWYAMYKQPASKALPTV